MFADPTVRNRNYHFAKKAGGRMVCLLVSRNPPRSISTITPRYHKERAGEGIMDITKFVVSRRDEALLYGDYSTYRAQLSRRILSIRKKLGRTTKKGAKYANKATVTAEDIANSHEYVHAEALENDSALTDCGQICPSSPAHF